MYKKIGFLMSLACILILSACSNHVVLMTYHDAEDVVYESEIFKEAVCSFPLTEDDIGRIAENIRSDFDYDIEISVAILDIQNNELIVSYGEIDEERLAIYAFWPISAAIIMEELGLSVHDEFENTEVVYSFLPWLWEQQGANTARGDLNISTGELLLLYASLVNGGRLFYEIGMEEYQEIFGEHATTETMELLSGLLDAIDDNWDVFRRVRDRSFIEDFKLNVIGSISEYMEYDGSYTGAWFIGLYPAESPMYVAVINLHYCSRYFEWENAETAGMPDIAVFAYELFEHVWINLSNENALRSLGVEIEMGAESFDYEAERLIRRYAEVFTLLPQLRRISSDVPLNISTQSDIRIMLDAMAEIFYMTEDSVMIDGDILSAIQSLGYMDYWLEGIGELIYSIDSLV
ncbi:MAG: hypothetical protein FWF81_02030 [Defluviitaleaceae bacterium]|nr:hypothetical protein [Defluviitaleaceae bacterium]